MDPFTDDRAGREPRQRATAGALAGLEALESQLSTREAPTPAPTLPRPVRQPATISPANAQPANAQPATVSPGPITPPGAPLSRAQRRRIRSKGPLVALLLPAALGLTSLMMLRGSTSATTGVGGFLLALLAAPLLPAFGAPLRTGSAAVVAAVLASAVMWFLLGAFAAQRATRSVAAGWGRFWGEYVWLTSCVWLGAVLAVVAANLVLGRVLL